MFPQQTDKGYQEKAVHVERTGAFDAAKKLSIKGKYLGITCVPDRWWSWAFTAIPAGKKLIDDFKPDVIWTAETSQCFLAWCQSTYLIHR